MLKVFLGGEGNNDIGSRWYRPMGEEVGVVEALLRRVRTSGWRVVGARSWQSIRKYRAGGALGRTNHADARNVLGLVLHAYEDACEMLAFVRDHDGDDLREQEIHRVLDTIAAFGFPDEYRYELAIVGGIARPSSKAGSFASAVSPERTTCPACVSIASSRLPRWSSSLPRSTSR